MASIDREIDRLFERFEGFRKSESDSLDLSDCASSACDAVASAPHGAGRAGRVALLVLLIVMLGLALLRCFRPALFGAAADVEEIEDPTPLLTNPGKPVALLLWATWCGHCKDLKPQFEALASEMRQVRFATCENEALQRSGQGEKLQVSAYPTVVALGADGRVLDRLVGNRGPDALRAFVAKNAA
jgi:thiol-disulfide isomerase/thioredoxin